MLYSLWASSLSFALVVYYTEMFLLDLAIQVTAIGSRPPTAQSKGEQLFHVECVSILSAGVAEEELGKGLQ